MNPDVPTTEEVEALSDGGSPPPKKKMKTHTVDPMKQLLGKAQTFLNTDFMFYYKNVGLFDTEEAFQEFTETLYKELPTTFRITSNTSFTAIVQAYMKDLFCGTETTTYELGGKMSVEKPSPLKWYPGELGWHFEASRKALRTSSLTKHLKHFLTHETEIGNISRQEAVSMVPPLLLDVQSHHKVLDMCAAPGSKTCQLIELLHQQVPATQTPSGFVMANDANIARCYLLNHQVHRLASPAIIVTHYDATQFPLIKLDADVFADKPEETLQFDRILCDVPCSGDGTIRKNPLAGSGWDSVKHFKVFKLQLAIAKRSAQLLKVGGRMVYSTCAFNPIEDEAVVAQLLRESKGALKLLDVSAELPQLQRRPGLSHWKVIDQKKRIYASWNDVPEKSRLRIPLSVFPPSADEASQFHLERCLRFYPHLQDTGGFFVAVIEKVGETDFIEAEVVPSSEELGLDDDAKAPKPERGFSEDPFFTIPSHISDSIKGAMRDYYGVQDADGDEFSHLVLRSQKDPNEQKIDEHGVVTAANPLRVEDINMVYKVSAPVHEVLRRTRGNRFVAAGIRFVENFSKRNKHLSLDCDWRVTAEALQGLASHLTRRVIDVGFEDFKTLLRISQPKFEEFTPALRESLPTLAKGGAGVVAIHFVPEALTPEQEASLAPREKLIRTTPQWVMGWLGHASFTVSIRKLELKSWRNLYLTSDYSFEFDPTINSISPEEKAALIEANKLKKAERDQERARNVRELKNQRRADRRNAQAQAAPSSEAAPPSGETSEPSQSAESS